MKIRQLIERIIVHYKFIYLLIKIRIQYNYVHREYIVIAIPQL